MRCEQCGAHNPAEARWCTQCYTPFADAVAGASTVQGDGVPGADAGPRVVEAAPTVQGDGVPGADAGPGVVEAAPTAGAAPGVVGTGAADGPATGERASSAAGISGSSARWVREVDGRVEWRCRVCESWVALEAAACDTCGASRVGFGDAAGPASERPEVPVDRMLGASAVLPGLGHLLAGRTGSAVTRMALWLLWAGGGLWWVLSTRNGRGPGLVLLLGALALWAATLADGRAISMGRNAEPFGVRGLLWLVVSVTGLLMVMVAFAAAGSLNA